MASQEFNNLFCTHVLGMAEKQSNLSEVVGDGPWGVDMGTGLITFGDVGYGLQVLGTQADGDHSWLWAWANEASGLPPTVVEKCTQLPAAAGGAIPELVERSFSQDVADGHQLSVVAGGLLGADAYYRCPYEGGQMFVLLFDDKLALQPTNTMQRYMFGVSKGMQAYPVTDHRLAVRSYAASLGLAVTENGDELTASGPEGSATATFNDRNLLAGLKANMAASDAPAAGSAPAPASEEPAKKRRFFRRGD